MTQGLKFLNSSTAAQVVETDDVVVIKGFASVSTVDRERDIVTDPREFDVDTFMASPVLLMNHKFLADQFGNQESAGRVTLAVPAYVRGISEDIITVHNLETDEFVDMIERRIAPNLEEGQRGLFVTAEVTHPIAKEKATSGEMGGLSWRGFVNEKADSLCDGRACQTFRQIDLLEISIVHTQAHPQSTFMIAKSVDGEVQLTEHQLNDINAYAVKFAKSLYPSKDTVSEYLKARNLTITSLGEDEMSFVAYLAAPSAFECSKSISISMGGVDFISAPLKENDDLIALHVGQLNTKPVGDSQMADTQKRMRLFLLNEQGLLTRFPGLLTQSMKSVTTAEGEEIDILTLEFPEADVQDTDETPEATAEVAEVEVADEIPEKSEIDLLKEELERINSLLKPVEEDAVEETPAEESELDLLKAELAAAKEAQAKLEQDNDEMKKLTKSALEKFNQAIPSQPVREEQIQKSLTNEPADARSVVGAFIGRSFGTL